MRSLTIHLYASPIGTLFESGGRFGMTFNQDYVERSPVPILSLAFLNARGRPSAPTRTSSRVSPFFANLLPEPGSRLRGFLAAQSGLNERDDMGFLRALGSDLPGAVTLAGEQWETPPEFAQHAPAAARQLRFSLAGVQMKFSVRRDKNGFLLPPDGTGGTHILKLPEPGKPELPENEFAMMTFAAKCGIDVPSIQLVRASSVRGLPEPFSAFEGLGYVIERFDRSPGGAIHIEDFAQIMRVRPEEKYERTSFDNVMRICGQVIDDAAVTEFVRRLVFTIAISNADMHLKNWSVRYKDPYAPALAPAYDYVCTAAFAGYDDFLALPLAGTVHWEAITTETFLRAARNARVQPSVVREAVREMTSRIKTAWPEARESLPPSIRRVIERQLSIPLFRSR